MAYQVLARKWRPQDLASVVGQEPVVTALRNAVTDGRIAQAYLFSGIRGVGKTSVARIFAKALNCPERGEGADPCNNCPTCEEITRGSDLDVIEVDAATYSKVEQVRELAESLKYGPARDRYKVVVIDEIHRLSRQAFDALLKIVEEPPDHLVFVFATTESEAVPATILSRCQEFPFRRVPAATLAEHLRRICDGEKIEASDTALRLIARAGEGSVRDAVALLDQLATYGSGTIGDDEAARILGGVGAEFHLGLLEAILAGKSDVVAAAVRDIEHEGRDPRHVFAEFLSYCRDALHLCLGGEPETIDLPGDEAEALAAAVRPVPYERLLRMLHLLLASEAVVRRSEQGGLAMEVALLRAAELPKLTRIEELLSGGPSGSETTAEPRRRPAGQTPRRSRDTAPPTRPPRAQSPPPPQQPGPPSAAAETPPAEASPPTETPSPQVDPAPEPEPADDRAPSIETTPPTAAAPPTEIPPPVETPPPVEQAVASVQPTPDPESATTAEPGASVSGNGASIEQFLERVSRQRQPLAAHLAAAQDVAFDDGVLRITAPAGDHWLRDALGRKGNRVVLEDCLHSVWGVTAKWHLAEGAATSATAPETDEQAPDHPALKHPTVQAALDIFGGTVESIDEGER
jgi:DNA polymerase-3 subunit gamma/tau